MLLRSWGRVRFRVYTGVRWHTTGVRWQLHPGARWQKCRSPLATLSQSAGRNAGVCWQKYRSPLAIFATYLVHYQSVTETQVVLTTVLMLALT